MASKRILVHICCGVCAAGAVLKLQEEGFEITGFFYNPNICPVEEYEKRFEAAKKVAGILNFKLTRDDTGRNEWEKISVKMANEPEGGKRCELCFKMRLKKTSEKANELGITLFTTSLTVGPHKNASKINEIGAEIDPAGFIARDFKKLDGFKKATDFAKKNGIYSQKFCGCAHSTRPGRHNESG